MKRRDLERHLRNHGARRLREGGNHTSGASTPSVRPQCPHHREIDFRLARKICADLEIPPPSEVALNALS
ncbi:MAG: addiction module toxin, HicA family [Actinobacteria bacterium]|nr:addiction module toxin, HicA family [Actinomycetota bacterium]